MIWSSFQKFLKSNTETDGVGTKDLIRYVLWAAWFGANAFVLLDINRPPMIVVALIFSITLFLTTKGYFNLARWISLLTALGVVTYLMVTQSGIRDAIMPGMIVILNAAGLLAGRKGAIIIGGISLGIVVCIGILETQGVIANRFSQETFLSDYLTVIIIILVASILQWLIISYTHQNSQQSRQKLIELENTQNLLAEAENSYRNLVEKIPGVVYVSEPGEGGEWQYVSPRIFELTGYTPDEWIKEPRLWYSRIHPEDAQRVIRAEYDTLRLGKMPQLEYRFLTRGGEYIWIYDEGLLTVDSSDHELVQGFLLDITDRKVAEEELQRRLNDLEAMKGVSETIITHSDLYKLIENTGDQIRQIYKASTLFIAIHNPTTNLINFPYDYEDGVRQPNDPIKYGEGLTTKVMESGKPLLITDNWQEEIKKYNPIYRNKKQAKSSLAVPIMTTNRTIGVISMDNTDMENVFSENDVSLLTAIANNLAVAIENTNLKESLKKEIEIQENLIHELEQKNEELERFTYTASHDLKSPLITIKGFLSYIEQDTKLGNHEKLALDIQRISEATEKMNRMLTDLLELSRVGHVIKKAENIPFDEIIREALQRVEGQLQEKRTKVKVASDFPIIYADKERLIEVIQNLVDNAIKFMGKQKNPLIEIGIKKENDAEVYFVKDNGVGMKKEFHNKIFGLFDKLDSASEGTGIGLALVKRIIEVHGGKIWVESQEGKGTTFYFTLASK